FAAEGLRPGGGGDLRGADGGGGGGAAAVRRSRPRPGGVDPRALLRDLAGEGAAAPGGHRHRPEGPAATAGAGGRSRPGGANNLSAWPRLVRTFPCATAVPAVIAPHGRDGRGTRERYDSTMTGRSAVLPRRPGRPVAAHHGR